jgi:hypothetical protein
MEGGRYREQGQGSWRKGIGNGRREVGRIGAGKLEKGNRE